MEFYLILLNFLLPERDKQAFWTTRFGRSDPLWLHKNVPEDEPHFDKSVMAAKDELGDLGGEGKPFFVFLRKKKMNFAFFSQINRNFLKSYCIVTESIFYFVK